MTFSCNLTLKCTKILGVPLMAMVVTGSGHFDGYDGCFQMVYTDESHSTMMNHLLKRRINRYTFAKRHNLPITAPAKQWISMPARMDVLEEYFFLTHAFPRQLPDKTYEPFALPEDSCFGYIEGWSYGELINCRKHTEESIPGKAHGKAHGIEFSSDDGTIRHIYFKEKQCRDSHYKSVTKCWSEFKRKKLALELEERRPKISEEVQRIVKEEIAAREREIKPVQAKGLHFIRKRTSGIRRYFKRIQGNYLKKQGGNKEIRAQAKQQIEDLFECKPCSLDDDIRVDPNDKYNSKKWNRKNQYEYYGNTY